ARRVTVYTWQGVTAQRVNTRMSSDTSRQHVYMSYLDVDAISRGEMSEVPRPEIVKYPPAFCSGPSGTLVMWTTCDRLDHRRISTIVRKLKAELARRFRHFLWNGLRITINGESVRPFDPLYLHPDAEVSGASLFGEEQLRYEIRADTSDPRTTGWVCVR